MSGEFTQLNSNDLTVGRQSVGVLNISDQAKVSATIVRLAQVVHGDGTLNITGENSELKVGLELNVGASGNDGKGTLNIRDGAMVDALGGGLGRTRVDSAGKISLESGGKLHTTTLQSVGTITIEGAESHLTTDIGFVGEGSTIVIDGGQLTNKEEQFELRDFDVMSVFNGGRVNTARWVVGQGATVSLTGENTLLKLDSTLSSAPGSNPNLQAGEGLVFGTVSVSNGANIESGNLFVASTGTITGDDGIITVAAGQALINAGAVEQGSSPGTLTIDGDYVQTETGRILFEIGGLTPDSEYDQLIITGNAEIDGTIVFDFIDDFLPSEGQTFNFLNVTGTTDLTEATFQVQGLASGWDYDIAPIAGGFRLHSLSDAQPIPEPSSLALAIAFSVAAVRTGRLKRSERSCC